jgi:hypothetical protein
MIRVQGRIECQTCDATHEVWLHVEEQELRSSSCDCSYHTHTTGKFFIDTYVYDLPAGWTVRSGDVYFCPFHAPEGK